MFRIPVGQEAPTVEVVFEGVVSLKLSPVKRVLAARIFCGVFTPTIFIVEYESSANRAGITDSGG